MKNFLILGLPRSRTAWLANFLTYKNSFCYHDLLAYCKDEQELKNKMNLFGYDFIGTADTAGFLLPKHDLFKHAPKVIIHRDSDDVIKSLENFLNASVSKKWIRYIDEQLNKVKGLHVNYSEINNNLEKIWHHCLNVPYNHERAKLLSNFNVVINDVELQGAGAEFTVELMGKYDG